MQKIKLGIHILLNLFDCDRSLLENVSSVKEFLNDAVIQAGLTKVEENFHQFEPCGVTGVILLAESHICIHTWPELNSAALDIFTCGNEFQARKVADILQLKLSAKNVEKQILFR